MNYSAQSVLSNSSLEPYLKALKKEAEQLKKEPLCELPFHTFRQFDTNGSRLPYEKLYFQRRRCMGVFALMAWLYKEEEYISLTEDYLFAVCNEFTWALPAHLDGNSLNERVNPLQLDLFACETAQSLAEITSILGSALHPAITLRCKQEIERRVFTPFLSRSTPFWWESCHINWAAVCGGSIGMAALYLMKDSERLDLMISQLLPVMEHFLSGFMEDGACLEGLAYWTYGMSYFTAFADLLFEKSNGEFDLLAQEKCKAIAAFQGKCYFKGGHTVSFSDASCTDSFRPGVTAYLSRYFKKQIPVPPLSSAAAFGTDPCARWCQMFRDFVWTEDFLCGLSNSSDSPDTDCPAHAHSSVLPDAKWLIFHGSDASGGAIKGGDNDEPHNHNDVGSFFFLLHGQEVLADLGAGEYTKDSFSDARYTIFTNQSLSHNVPVINGNGQKTGKQYCARSYYFNAKDNPDTSNPNRDDPDSCFTEAVMDIAPAYGDTSLSSLIRSLKFDDKKHRLTLCDRFCFTVPCSSLEERFITRQKPELCDGIVTLYSESMESCTLTYDKSLLTASLSTDIHYRHEDGSEELVYLLRFTLNQPSAQPMLEFSLCWT